MLLIFPPLAKACEPPAGIARLAAALVAHNIPCQLLDANLEGQLWLLNQPLGVVDTWSRRADKGRTANLERLRDFSTYASPARYQRAVHDLNRLLAVAAADRGIMIGLADYQDARLSPLRSADLLHAAANPGLNPFFSYFCARLPELLDGVTTVGLSLNYLGQALCTFSMAGFIRQHYPAIKIVLGGGLVTSWLQRPGWRSPFGELFDKLVCGPGEAELLAFLGQHTPQRDPMPPLYDPLPLQDYLAPGLLLPYSAAGGCYWNRCSFCPECAEGNAYQPLPLSHIRAELDLLCRYHSPRMLHFLDSAISPALLRNLAERPPGVPWYGFVRIDEQLADPDFCFALKRSGCAMLKIGLESGDQGVLEQMNKGIELAVAARVLTNLERAGIPVYCYLLFGTPGETIVEARRTLDFVVAHQGALTFLNLAIFNMPLNSSDAELYGTEPFYEGDLSLYTAFRHPHGWHRGAVRRFLDQEFKRHPAVAAIIRNDPPQFGSNHAPLLIGIR
jgi:hypothetical protein